MSTISDDAVRIARYRRSVARMDAWIEKHLLPGDAGWCEPASVDGYFSLVLYANAVGRHDWTARAMGHLQRKYLEGIELIQGANRDAMRTYMPSWVAWAAHEAEYFDLSRRLLEGIATYQDRRSGGFFAGRDQRDKLAGPIDFDSTTMSIIAMARAGRVEAAQRGADFLLNLWATQPARDDRFQTAWAEPDGLQGVEAGEMTVLRWSQPKQGYYKVGLFTQALMNAYGATGRQAYRDAALTVYDHTVAQAADLWTNTISHKMCWAAVTLYHTTGNDDYLDHACRFADQIISTQVADGCYTYPELWPAYPPPQWAMIPNLGCQFALWIVRVLRALEARGEAGP